MLFEAYNYVSLQRRYYKWPFSDRVGTAHTPAKLTILQANEGYFSLRRKWIASQNMKKKNPEVYAVVTIIDEVKNYEHV